MKPKTMILMLVAVGCGLAAAVLVKQLAARPAEENFDIVLVAKTDMKPGEKIANIDAQFEQKKIAKGFAPFGAFTKDDVDASEGKKLLNKVLVKRLTKGEVITDKNVTDENITKELGPGERALSIPVRVEAMAAGFILPGSRVDLITRYQQDGKTVSRIFLQDIKVLTIGQDTTKPEGAAAIPNATVATLAVKPKHAAMITWAMGAGGQISMALRKPDDNVTLKPSEMVATSLGISSDVSLDEEQKTDTVLIALRDLDKGEDLKGQDLRKIFDEKRVPAGMFDNDTFVKTTRDALLQDAKAREPIKKGTPLLRSLLGEPQEAKKVEKRAVEKPETFTTTIWNGTKAHVTVLVKVGTEWRVQRSYDLTDNAPPPSEDQPEPPSGKSGSEGK